MSKFCPTVPAWVARTGFHLRWYFIGLLVNLIVTDTAKIVVGRLRPNFIDVCKPDFSQFNCTDVYGNPVYVTNYVCTGDPSMVPDTRQLLLHTKKPYSIQWITLVSMKLQNDSCLVLADLSESLCHRCACISGNFRTPPKFLATVYDTLEITFIIILLYYTQDRLKVFLCIYFRYSWPSAHSSISGYTFIFVCVSLNYCIYINYEETFAIHSRC